MIRVHVLENVLGMSEPLALHIEPTTVRDAIDLCRHPGWAPDAEIAVHVTGRRLRDDELGAELEDESDVVLCPVAGATALGTIAVIAALYSLYRINQLIVDPPDASLGKEQERGDEESSVYAWDRIHTNYRPGYPVPVIYGEVDTGGQVIYSDVRPYFFGGEYLRVVLALCEGRIESVGEVTGGALGEIDRMGGFTGSAGTLTAIPQDIRVNGNRLDHTTLRPGAEVWLRCGELRQSPLPDPFAGTRTVADVADGSLPDAGAIALVTITPTDAITTATLLFAFPSGVYQQAPNGDVSAYSVTVDVHWRLVGGGGWNYANSFDLSPAGGLIRRTYYVTTRDIVLPQVSAQFEVRVGRATPKGGSDVVSTLELRQVTYGAAEVFRYPGVALLGLNVQASEQTTSGRSEFIVRVRGRRVRVYDSGLGISSSHVSRTQDGRYWLVPPSGDPFLGIWSFPVGRNPAWILADFLTDTRSGLGLSDSEIDWATFRDWADFCDQSVTVGAGSEALCTFDASIDAPRAAWDIILDICRAGRAVPIRRGKLFSVVYQYRDAHGRGTNSVAAKEVTQLFHAGALSDLEVTYNNRMTRPAVYVAQITNEDKDHAQDTIDVEDPLGGFDDPSAMTPIDYVKETVQLYGLTRPSQVRRDLLLRHAIARDIKSECSFGVAIEALAADVGDLVDIQSDILRPFDVESYATRVYASGTGVSSLALTRDVVLAPAITYGLRIRVRSGAVESRTITSVAGTYVAGSTLTFSGGAINIDKGAPVVFGELAKLVKTFQIVHTALAEDLKRTVRAVEWVPSIYDVAAVDDDMPESEEVEAFFSPSQWLVTDTGATETAELVEEVAAVRTSADMHTIGWSRPPHRSSAPARVYIRSGGEAWEAVADTKGSSVQLPLVAGQSYEVAVTIADPVGLFQSPEEVETFTVIGDEFAAQVPPQVRNGSLVVEADDDAIALEWEPVSGVAEYEVRRGAHPLVDQVAMVTDDTVAVLAGPPALPDAAEGATAETIVVLARGHSGLYSSEPLTLTATPLATGRPVVSDQSIDPGAEGVLVNLNASGSAPYELTLLADQCLGTWTSDEYALGYNAEAIIAMGWVAEAESADAVDDWGFAVDSGEARWRYVDGRPASPAQPGGLIDELVDDLTSTLDDLSDRRLVGAWKGEAGAAFAVRVWFRTAKTGGSISTAAWRRYTGPVAVVHDEIQWRVELFRDDPNDTVRVRGFRVRRYL